MRRKWLPGSFVPCSRRHKSCSPDHAELVRDYQRERERQETANEVPIAYGEFEGRLIDFKKWLISHRRKR